jgi:hypothetical protein
MKDIKEMDVAELEWLHKQIEGSSMADKEVLKGFGRSCLTEMLIPFTVNL